MRWRIKSAMTILDVIPDVFWGGITFTRISSFIKGTAFAVPFCQFFHFSDIAFSQIF